MKASTWAAAREEYPFGDGARARLVAPSRHRVLATFVVGEMPSVTQRVRMPALHTGELSKLLVRFWLHLNGAPFWAVLITKCLPGWPRRASSRTIAVPKATSLAVET